MRKSTRDIQITMPLGAPPLPRTDPGRMGSASGTCMDGFRRVHEASRAVFRLVGCVLHDAPAAQWCVLKDAPYERKYRSCIPPVNLRRPEPSAQKSGPGKMSGRTSRNRRTGVALRTILWNEVSIAAVLWQLESRRGAAPARNKPIVLGRHAHQGLRGVSPSQRAKPNAAPERAKRAPAAEQAQTRRPSEPNARRKLKPNARPASEANSCPDSGSAGRGAERSQQGFEEDRDGNDPEARHESKPFRAGDEQNQAACDPNGRAGVRDWEKDAGRAPHPKIRDGQPRVGKPPVPPAGRNRTPRSALFGAYLPP